MRILVAGCPRAGKTHYADETALSIGVEARHTDDLIATHAWSEASAKAATWFDEPGDLVIEGVTIVRALRKWFIAHPEGKPCDKVVYLDKPREELSKGQASMRKACRTIWDRDVVPELRRRLVEIEEP